MADVVAHFYFLLFYTVHITVNTASKLAQTGMKGGGGEGVGGGGDGGRCLLKGELISLCTLPIPPKVINC